MNKLFIIGLPRTGTTSISVTLLEHFNVAHTAYTKHAFDLADVVSDCPCFSDYQQLHTIFPDAKFVYLQRSLDQWIPSIQMLLKKMIPAFNSTNYINPILKRSFAQTFDLNTVDDPLDITHLTNCYQRHEQEALDYFQGKKNLLSIDIRQPNSLPLLLAFLDLPFTGDEVFPHLNIGKRVDNWKDIKHPNKVNPNAAGREGRKFFDY